MHNTASAQKIHSEGAAVSIQIVDNMHTACTFWIGLTTTGPLYPTQLLDTEDLGTLFRWASSTGVRDLEPIMLSDVRPNQQRLVLLSRPPTAENESQWIESITTTVTSWDQKAVGIYLAPELTGIPESLALLNKLIFQLVAKGKATSVFLYLGNHSENELLNSSLDLKSHLKKTGYAIGVYHL